MLVTMGHAHCINMAHICRYFASADQFSWAVGLVPPVVELVLLDEAGLGDTQQLCWRQPCGWFAESWCRGRG